MSIQANPLAYTNAYNASMAATSSSSNVQSGNTLPGNSDSTGATATNSSTVNISQEARAYLAKYLQENPVQHMRDAILKDMGLTEAGIAAKPPAERAAIEKTIAAKIKQEMAGLHANTQTYTQPTALNLA